MFWDYFSLFIDRIIRSPAYLDGRFRLPPTQTASLRRQHPEIPERHCLLENSPAQGLIFPGFQPHSHSLRTDLG